MGLYIKNLQIVSSAFALLERIPERYTGEGENISPPMKWGGLPPGTQQLALICHDPDAPLPRGFTHWVLYGIPPTVNQLAVADSSKFTAGRNSSEQLGYTGPIPPVGHGVHH